MPSLTRQVLAIMSLPGRDPAFARLTPYVGQAAMASLMTSCLLDVLSQALRLNGVQYVVVVDRSASARLHAVIPAGVSVLMVPEADRPGGNERFALAHLRGQGYERVVSIRADTLAVAAIDIGTAFGTLATADVVVGPTSAGGRYLAGGRATAIETLGDDFPGDPDALLAAARDRGLAGRRITSRRTLAEIATPDELAGLATLPGIGHRVASWVEDQIRPG